MIFFTEPWKEVIRKEVITWLMRYGFGVSQVHETEYFESDDYDHCVYNSLSVR